MTEQTDLPPLSREETIERLQHVLTLLESIADSDGNMSVEPPLPEARVYLRGIIGCGIVPTQPAEDERVKEACARDTAQEIVIESSKAAGYADSTWLDGNFKHELTNRITAALLPVQPGASTPTERAVTQSRSNHFSDEVIDKGTFPSHISGKGDAYYKDGTVIPTAASTPTESPRSSSSQAWRKWFDCLGDKATAEVVNATANLVTDERLAALVSAQVLPAYGGAGR